MCRCRICFLRHPQNARRVVDVLFRDIVMNSYGADVVRVWTAHRV